MGATSPDGSNLDTFRTLNIAAVTYEVETNLNVDRCAICYTRPLK